MALLAFFCVFVVVYVVIKCLKDMIDDEKKESQRREIENEIKKIERKNSEFEKNHPELKNRK